MCYVIVAQSCLTLCNSLDWSHPGSSGHEIFQARILEWVAISFSRESSSPWDTTCVSWIVGRLLTTEPSRLWTWFSLILNLNFTSLTQPCQIHWKLKCLSIASSLYFCFIDYTKAFDCVDHNKLENSSRDGNTRPPDLSPEKSVCRSTSNSWNWTQNNRLAPNWERSTSRLYIATLLI